MPELAALSIALLVVASGCAGATASAAPQLPLRVLSSEAAVVQEPERDATGNDGVRATPTPRIGAPGGSGAGSRRVRPTQSGNETVGGLPVGICGGSGPAGRG